MHTGWMPVKPQLQHLGPLQSAMSGDASNIWCLSCDRERRLPPFMDICRQRGYLPISILTLSEPCSEEEQQHRDVTPADPHGPLTGNGAGSGSKCGDGAEIRRSGGSTLVPALRAFGGRD
ncbi:unnamed protein product [Boreogadus saida]